MEGRVRVMEKPAFFQRHIWKNRYLFLIENASPIELIVLAPWVLMFEILMWLYLLARLPSRLHGGRNPAEAVDDDERQEGDQEAG